MQLIGAGLGRTGTYSLRLAIDRLGFGPCHHMEAVVRNLRTQVPQWFAALDGHADWPAIYAGFNSAVDWPTACFYRELHAAYPQAKFILSLRSPEQWADSFASTIQRLVAERHMAPPELQDWLVMAEAVISRNGFPPDADRDSLIAAFNAHNEAVKRVIPADRLLVYQVSEGWEPLAAFLGASVPDEPFPRSNQREEFWDLLRRDG